MPSADPAPSRSTPGALDGVRVLDLTSVIMGPYATQILGDLGADVISIEDIAGDVNRAMGAGHHPQLSGTALNLLRNKRNVSLDLKHPDGRAAFLRIAATSDVVVTNLRPGPLGRLGLTYDDVRAHRPDVVFCQAQGWPSDSERADDPAYDDIVQAATGIADLFERQTGVPALMPTIVADKVCGMTIAYSVLAALRHRDRTGEGQRIEVAMVETMRSFLLVEHGGAAIAVPPAGPPGHQRVLTPFRRPQQTSDGWISVLPYSRKNYDDLFGGSGRADLLDHRLVDNPTRLAHSDSLYRDVADVLATNTTDHWLAFCRKHDIPATAIGRLDEIIDELPIAEHPVAGPYRQIPPPVRFDRTPMTVRRPAPLVGADGDEVLVSVGYTTDEIAALRSAGALRGG